MSDLVDAVAPGDVHAIANTGARLRACSDAVAEIRRDLSDNRTADIWSGLAAEQFDEARRDVVDALRGVAERFGRTGEALTVHAQRLDGLQARARILALQADQLSREVAAGERALKLARGSDDPMSLAEDSAREHLDALKYQRRSLERAMHELRDEWDRLGKGTAHAIDEARDELDDRRSVWGMAGSVLRGISRRLPGGGVFGAFAGLFGDDARDALDASENFMTPAGVYALLSRWDRSELEKFAEAEYELVSHLDGAPAWMRDIANRRKVQDEIERLRGGGSELDLAAASWYEKLLATEGFILVFDAAKGRVAVAFGDPDGADNIAVMVPGMSTTMWNFGGVMKDAERLKGAMDKYAADPGVANAVVAWLDYDPPDVNPQSLDLLRAASEDRAREGAAALRPFVDGMNANAPDSNLTVVGHSYGSLTTGIAARDGHLGADDVVFIGSPGTGVRHASDLHLDPGAQVFAAAADGDLVTKVPEASGRAGNLIGAGIGGAIAGPGGAVAGWVLGGNATDNWHGVAPTDSSYGATVFGTDGSHGHSEYYKAGRESQINIALIATRGQPTP